MGHQDASRSQATRSLTEEAVTAAAERAEAAEKLRAVLDELEEPRALDARVEHAADLLEGL